VRSLIIRCAITVLAYSAKVSRVTLFTASLALGLQTNVCDAADLDAEFLASIKEAPPPHHPRAVASRGSRHGHPNRRGCLRRVSGRVRKAVDQAVGQDFGPAHPFVRLGNPARMDRQTEHKRKRLRRCGIGTLLAE
jgi:hypothetical protein